MILARFDFLQLFAEGGDGGASAGGEGSSTGVEASGRDPFANAPKKAKDLFAKLQTEAKGDITSAKAEASDQVAANTAKEDNTPMREEKRIPFKELIASEAYKADYERHIQKAVKDRTKRHDAEMGEVNGLLALVGQRYGLDQSSDTFRADLAKALENDDSVYEKYAEEHDVPIDEARTIVNLKQQLDRANKQAEERRIMEEDAKVINALRQSAEQTKARYPDFDLDTAIQDPQFRQLTKAWNGNTTMAYESLNHSAIVQEAERRAAAEAKQAVANSVRSNLSRPTEGGISSSTSATPEIPDFDSMDLKQLREWASKQSKRR